VAGAVRDPAPGALTDPISDGGSDGPRAVWCTGPVKKGSSVKQLQGIGGVVDEVQASIARRHHEPEEGTGARR
jgi:hypothetical protein